MVTLKKWLTVLALVGALAGLAWLQLDRPTPGVDDADIFFVYAQNLTSGHGLVYNAGGERVEGYTSTLWMLLIAAVMLVSPDPTWLLFGITILCTTSALAMWWEFVERRFSPEKWPVLWLLLWSLGMPAFIVWHTLTLMDTALWLLLLTWGGLTALQGAPRRLSWPVVLLLLTRPESLVWAPTLIFVAALTAALRRGWRQTWRESLPPLLAYGLTLGGLTAFRLWYFGVPLPNTYYAKVSPDWGYNLREGFKYLLRFWQATPGAVLSALASLGGLWLNGRRVLARLRWPADTPEVQRQASFFGGSLLALVGMLLPVTTGGDHFALFRFYQPVWPLLAWPVLALSGEVCRELAASARQWVIRGGAGLLLLLALWQWGRPVYAARIQTEFVIAETGQHLGQELNAIFPHDPPSIGVITAGGVAWTYHGTVIDTMGLNNVAVAHAPGERYGLKNHAAFNEAVFLQQQPDLLLLNMLNEGTEAQLQQQWQRQYKWNNYVLKGMLADERFSDLYRPVILAAGEHRLLAYVRRDYLRTLPARGVSVKPLTP